MDMNERYKRLLERRSVDEHDNLLHLEEAASDKSARRVDVRDLNVSVPEDAFYIRRYQGLDAFGKGDTIYLVDPRTKKVVRTQKTNNRVYSMASIVAARYLSGE